MKQKTRKAGMKDEFARALMIRMASAGKIAATQDDRLFVKGRDWQEGYVAAMRAAVGIVAEMSKAEVPHVALSYAADAVEALRKEVR